MLSLFKKYIDDPDVQLMLKCQKDDKEAFEQLLDKHKSMVINIIYRFMADKNEAEDLAQEVFLKIYTSRHNYKPKAKFTTWVFKITANLCLNHIRNTKKYTSQTISMDETSEQKEEHPAQQFEDTKQAKPNEALLKKELEEVVREAIQSLPPNQGMAVILRRYQDLSYEEIAQTLHCSVLSVKALLFRAKENLRRKLKNYI